MDNNKILLVDDERILLDSLEVVLVAAGYDVIGKMTDGSQALKALEVETPNLIFADLNMPVMGGLELIKHVKQRYPKTKILVLTTFYDEENIVGAICGGADGYLLKDAGRNEIISAASEVLAGQSILDRKILTLIGKVMNERAASYSSPQHDSNSDLPDSLTKREIEICGLLAEGYTNSQIAGLLFITEGTIKNYISSIYDKIGIRDRAALCVYLRQQIKHD